MAAGTLVLSKSCQTPSSAPSVTFEKYCSIGCSLAPLDGQFSIVTGVPKQPKVVIVVHKAINSGVIQQQVRIHLSAATQPCRFLA